MADFYRDPISRQRVECLANYWLRHAHLTKAGALTWPYAATRSNKLSEQTFKATWTIIFPVEAYQRGIYFTKDHMLSLLNTYKSTVESNDGVRVEFHAKISEYLVI